MGADAPAKQAGPQSDSMLSEVPTDSAIVQVSDQPILSAMADTLGTQASASASAGLQTEEAVAGQPPQAAAATVDDTGAAMLPVDQASQQPRLLDNPAVLQVSDQPILTSGPAPDAAPAAASASTAAPPGVLPETAGAQTATPDAERLVAAVPQQLSLQPILASTDVFTAPAQDQTAMGVPADVTDPPSNTAAIPDSGTAIAVSDQPILSETAGENPQTVHAHPVHVMSSQPLLGPVTTQPGAPALAMQEASPATPAVHAEESTQPLGHLSTESKPTMSSQPQLGPVLTQPGELPSRPSPMDPAPLTPPITHVEVSQQHVQPLRPAITEPASVMSSQPLLGSEPAQPQALPSVHQVQLIQQQQVPMQ